MDDKVLPRPAAQAAARLLLFLLFAFGLCPPVEAWHKSVNLRGAGGRFVLARGGAAVTGGSARAAGGTFTLLDLDEGRLTDGDEVSFRTSAGGFLVAGAGGVVRANGTTPGGASSFIIEKLPGGSAGDEIVNGDAVALRAGRGTYLIINAAGNVVTGRRPASGPAAVFTLAVLGDPAPLVLSGPFSVPQSIHPAIFGVDNTPSPSQGAPATECRNFLGLPFPTCYKGHRGTDFPLAGGFPQMDIANINVAAAAPGKVVAAADGNPDRCTKVLDPPATPGGEPTPRLVCLDAPDSPGLHNFVTVLQDDGLLAYYFHLQRDSVAVRRGTRVACGQLLGRVGSSGDSLIPHLHFELSRLGPNDSPPEDEGEYFIEASRTRPGAALDPYALRLWARMHSPTVPAMTCSHPSTNLVRGVGQTCGGPFSVCAPPLACVQGACRNVGVAAGGACGANNLCAPGLECRGGACRLPCACPPGCLARDGKCSREVPRTARQDCSQPFGACESPCFRDSERKCKVDVPQPGTTTVTCDLICP